MTADANEEKTQSKFPRSSLRARNKTMMMQPADVADFQVGAKDDGFSALDVDDIFGEGLDESGDVKESQRDGESDLGPDDFGAVAALSDDSLDDLGSVSSEESEEHIHELHHEQHSVKEPREESRRANHEDIFSAPVTHKDESVDPMSRALDVAAADPISRSTKTVSVEREGVVGASAMRGSSEGVLRESAYDETVGQSWRTEVRGEARIEWKKPSKLVGFLVSFAADHLGSYVELREGRLLISSEGSSSDSCLVIRHESVSPMHAIMRISGSGDVLILDQLSEHGTKIKRAENGKEECLMGDKSGLKHGDVVIFGACEYHVALLGAAALRR